MILEQIKLNNFLSHEATDLDFGPSCKMLLDGMSGAGKSSIVDAIIWCLYGEARAQGKSLIRKGQEDASVQLDVISTDGESVRITRSITSKGGHKLEVQTKKGKGKYKAIPHTGIKAVQHWIEHDLVGASYTLFVNSVVYLQEGSELFVSQPANKRKELLLEIVKAEDYDTYYEEAKAKLQGYAVESAAIRSTIESDTSTIARLSVSGDDKKELVKQKAELEVEMEKNKDDLASAQKMEDAHMASRIRVTEIRGQVAAEQIVAGRIASELQADELFNQRSAADVEALKDASKQLADARLAKTQIAERIEVGGLRSKAAQEEAEYIAFMSSRPRPEELDLLKQEEDRAKRELEGHASSPVCPSGDKCPYMGKKDVSSMVVALALANEKVVAKVAEIGAWETLSKKDWRASRKELEAAEQELSLVQNLIDSTTAHEAVLVSRVTHTPSQYTKADLMVAEASVADLQRQLAETEEEDLKNHGRLFIPAIQEKISRVSRSIGECESKIVAAENNEAAVKEIVASIKANEKKSKDLDAKIEKMELVKEAFGSKGIRAVVIDYLIPRLEERVNAVLSKLSEFSIRLDTQTEKVDGGSKEGLFITIINDVGEELPYEAYSGGEKLKITVAISEAFASMSRAKFRILDETVMALDGESLIGFMNVLERLLADTQQVVCVSHLSEIKDMFTEKVTITKHNGISRINQ